MGSKDLRWTLTWHCPCSEASLYSYKNSKQLLFYKLFCMRAINGSTGLQRAQMEPNLAPFMFSRRIILCQTILGNFCFINLFYVGRKWLHGAPEGPDGPQLGPVHVFKVDYKVSSNCKQLLFHKLFCIWVTSGSTGLQMVQMVTNLAPSMFSRLII